MKKPALKFKGVILDLDGVITRTASVHSAAWKEMFDEFLENHAKENNRPFMQFSSDDYLQYVDGKPRQHGVTSFLESRGIELPLGDPDDEPGKHTVWGLGNKKNISFQKIIKTEGPEVFQSSVDFVKCLKAAGLRVGLATSSKNCSLILEKAGITKLFETQVDGVVSYEMKLKGKPNPDIFTTAAENLDLDPNDCVLVEDAISGVEAGRRGNFGLVLGVARNLTGDELLANGADIVVTDLGHITLQDLNDWFTEGRDKDSWNLTYYGYTPEEEKLRETLCAIGNGYFGTRGCHPTEDASDNHYPGTYIAGVYNRLPTKKHGHNICNNDFVNNPNWLPIQFKIGKADFKSPFQMEILDYRQTLDMKKGVLKNMITFKDGTGHITQLFTRMFASMANPHMGAVRFKLIPLNYSGTITIRSFIDGGVINWGVPRYRELNSRHLMNARTNRTRDGIQLTTKTNKSKVEISMTAKTRVFEDGILRSHRGGIFEGKNTISECFEIEATEGRTYTVEKMVSIYTSLDKGVKSPAASSRRDASEALSYDSLLKQHVRAWGKIWDKMDISIWGDRFTQKVMRLHMYHLIVSASPHNVNIDAGMTARGLHGEAYRGHVFWDELYIFPFYNLHFPEVTKALLMYRYRRLDDARKYARDHGYKGAMFPWQTADDGREWTQTVHYNPMSGKWDPDDSCRQRHVSIAIFYNTWSYIAHTRDLRFLNEYGAELMLDIARFWASISVFDPKDGKYHISGVMGPDEYHEKLPDSDEHGLRDNAYTNLMVVWLLRETQKMLETLPKATLQKLLKKVKFNLKKADAWTDIIEKMNVVVTDENIISQFDGYMGLKELDWDAYREKYENIHRMDRILKSENDSPDHYKVAKQADTLMSFYVLSPKQVANTLKSLGYNVGDPVELLKKNYTFYEKRTSHGSTLSKVVHAAISKDMGENDVTWQWFMEALESDIFDTQGGTTPEGIHCGVMAGTINILIRNFAGISFDDGVLCVEPNLPDHWKKLSLKIWHQNIWYELAISDTQVRIGLLSGKKKVLIQVAGKEYTLSGTKKKTIKLD